MQDSRLNREAQTPVFQAQRRTEHQVEPRDQKNRSTPVPLDDEELDRVGGGYSAPRTTW